MTYDDDGDTLDDDLVDCPACGGSGRGETTDLVKGNGCFLCHGLRKVPRSRAAAFHEANRETPT